MKHICVLFNYPDYLISLVILVARDLTPFGSYDYRYRVIAIEIYIPVVLVYIIDLNCVSK